jgi:metal-responsive CopG/Arc/MetJ family transcriptional regulator
MKTAISIPDDLFEEAESVAKRLGLSRSEMFARAVRAFVQRNRGQGVTDRLNRVYSAECSKLDPSITHMQTASIPREEW